MILEVKIPGPPVPQGRPRASTLGTTRKVVMYDPPRSKAWKKHAQKYYCAAMYNRESGDTPHIPEGPVFMRVIALFPRPKAMKGEGRELHTKNSDLDNIVKAVCDSANDMLYTDDAQVAHVVATKWYAASGEEPCVMVWVSDQDIGLFDCPRKETE